MAVVCGPTASTPARRRYLSLYTAARIPSGQPTSSLISSATRTRCSSPIPVTSPKRFGDSRPPGESRSRKVIDLHCAKKSTVSLRTTALIVWRSTPEKSAACLRNSPAACRRGYVFHDHRPSPRRQLLANFVEKLGSVAPSKFLGDFFESRFAVRSHFNVSQSDLGGVFWVCSHPLASRIGDGAHNAK